MKNKYLLTLFVSIFLVAGCTTVDENIEQQVIDIENIHFDDLLTSWPNTVFYEIFPRAFYDTSGNGIGDINGMTEKLDYLQELGIEGIWLMPIHPSPSYHGYDVTNYYDINPEYGTMDDFKTFLAEAHDRNIKVLVDLVVNHTSTEHPWFQNAISSEDSKYRDWYVWADDDTNLRQRGEWGQLLWHGEAPHQYLGVFWGGMPDLNFDNPEVRNEMIRIGQFWLEEIGVDGFRLDAAKHIFPFEKEKNIEWWQEFRTAMEEVREDVFLVGEVWDLPQVGGPYLEDGLHSTFNFDLAEEILSAARQERGGTLVAKLLRTLNIYEMYSDDFIDSTFITNHDMNRVMSELRGNEERAKMAASLLLTLPGAPFIYYGEEIGMRGEKPDEHIREPMLWYDTYRGGQTTWIDPKHDTDANAPSVEKQLEDPNSLLNHYKKMIYLRRTLPALQLGNIEESPIRESGIVAFIRSYNNEQLYVIHNLSNDQHEINFANEGIIIFKTDEEAIYENETLLLPAYSTVIFSY